ncbi:MAG: hypothetical protein JWP20_1494 [Roseomonas sp.]|nr:hypothetical protein [Roseomonas sp.]
MHLRLAARLALVLVLGPLATGPAWGEPLRAVYSVRGGGMQVMQVEVVFDLDTPGRYSIQAAWRTTGLARLFGAAQFSAGVEGRWAGGEARPLRYSVDGTYRGEARRTVMDYPTGQPVLRSRLPEHDPERDPVPESMMRNTIDQFTAIARLSRQLAETGRCDGQAAVFDGARRVDMRARTAGRDMLFPWSSAWHGEAVRCGFIGQQLAGFKHDDGDRAREPQEGTAWMAPPRPGDAPIPVRLEIPSRLFGAMTIYLMEVGPAMRAASNDASSAGNSAGRSATGAPAAASRGP